jgi:hypothetical protein
VYIGCAANDIERFPLSHSRAALAIGVIVASLVACSGSSEEASSRQRDDSSRSGGGGDDEGVLFTDDEGNYVFGGSADFQPCAAETVATEAVRLDIYVMFDRSCSMSCPPEMVGPGLCCPGDPRPRIDQVRAAVGNFLNAPESAGIGVGIGYFGHFEPGATSCDPAAYASAAVEIGVLPDNAAAITTSLQQSDPVGETPTGAAIRGACSYAQGWKARHPAHSVVILLVTDGVPEAPVTFSCNPTVDDAAQAARNCFAASPGIPTYVLGVGGRLDNLDQLAEAGGTGQAHLVGANTDVTDEVLEALNRIRESAAVRCEFQVPPAPQGERIDPSLVNVTFEDSRGDVQVIQASGSLAGCGDEGGWYYDDPTAPSIVKLCPSTCDKVTANLIAASVRGRSARIDLQYGCRTVVITR